MPLWGHLLGFLHLYLIEQQKNFLILKNNYTMEVCVVLYESFVSKRS